MGMDTPLDLIAQSQKAAKSAGDGNGRFCQLATVDEVGNPRVRTVIMHDVTQRHIGCIFSAYHNKAQHLKANGRFQVYVWHPTQGNQFMVNGYYEPMPDERLQRYWDEFLSLGAKRLDLFYTTDEAHRPGSAFPDRASLEAEYATHVEHLQTTEDPLLKPPHIIGAQFVAERVEHLHVSDTDGRFHHRTVYELENGMWQRTVVVP